MSDAFIKDKDAVLDFGLDWTTWLEDDEMLNSSQWLVPNGLTKVADEFDEIGHTLVWISGGAPGITYKLTNKIQTNKGRTDDRSMFIRVIDR